MPTAYLSSHTGIQVDAAVSAIRYSGTYVIPNDAQAGMVTGQAWPYIPSKMLLIVQVPSGGLALSACLVGDPTTDGFSFYLVPGATDVSGTYKLFYFPVP